MSYAPVKTFEMTLRSGAAGVYATGIAAPADGPRPSALMAVVGAKPIAMTKAARFSPEALQSRRRAGWCGFKISDLARAAALGAPVELKCVASGAVLAGWQPEELLAMPQSDERPSYKSLPDFRSIISFAYGFSKIIHAAPFLDHYRKTRGDWALIEACYRWTLRRSAARVEVDTFVSGLKVGWTSLECCEQLLASDEFKPFAARALPGPFESGFPFDLAVLDS